MRKVILSGKMAAIIAVYFLLLQCVSVQSSEEKNKISKTSDLTGFKSIGFNISGTLYLEQGSGFSIRLEGDENDLEKIVAELNGTTLIIKTKPGSFSIGRIDVYVQMPEIEGLSVSGSGDIIAEKSIETTDLQLNISGSGNIDIIELKSNQVNSSISGSGGIKVKGNNESLTINIAGSGDMNAVDLISKNVGVNIAGSGSAKVYASENLKSEIAGSGNVYYKGNPLIDSKSVGSGSIQAY